MAMLALAGCKKTAEQKQAQKEKAKTEAAAKAKTTPKPTPTPVATPTPKPPINKNAVAIVLCYHRFEDRPKDYLAIKPSEFEKQMQEIKDNGFTVISLQDLIAWRKGEKSIPAKSAVITIDDGYESGYSVAWPILKKFGYPWTAFIYINYIGSGGESISWDQLAEMRDAGVDIECHTFTHPDLHGKGPFVKAADRKKIAEIGYTKWLQYETVDAKKELQRKLGIKVDAFAYPYGKWNSAVIDVLKNGGFDAAFTVYGKPTTFNDKPFRIGRYSINSREPKMFQMAMNMKGGGFTPPKNSGSTESAIMHLAVTSLKVQPGNGATITTAKPMIKAHLLSLGKIKADSVNMLVSGVGKVPAKFDAKSKIISYQIPNDLSAGIHSVIISAMANGKKVETRWNFTVSEGGASAPATPAATPKKTTPKKTTR